MFIHVYHIKLFLLFQSRISAIDQSTKSKPERQELESEGLLTFDTSQPPLHAWVPGKDDKEAGW